MDPTGLNDLPRRGNRGRETAGGCGRARAFEGGGPREPAGGVEILRGVGRHPDPLHEADRWKVERGGERDDFGEAELSEPVAQGGAGGFGREAPAPGVPGKTPSDFHAGGEGRFVRWNRQPRESEERAGFAIFMSCCWFISRIAYKKFRRKSCDAQTADRTGRDKHATPEPQAESHRYGNSPPRQRNRAAEPSAQRACAAQASRNSTAIMQQIIASVISQPASASHAGAHHARDEGTRDAHHWSVDREGA